MFNGLKASIKHLFIQFWLVSSSQQLILLPLFYLTRYHVEVHIPRPSQCLQHGGLLLRHEAVPPSRLPLHPKLLLRWPQSLLQLRRHGDRWAPSGLLQAYKLLDQTEHDKRWEFFLFLPALLCYKSLDKHLFKPQQGLSGLFRIWNLGQLVLVTEPEQALSVQVFFFCRANSHKI